MSIDVLILKVLRNREKYHKLIASMPISALDEKTQVLLKDYGEYFSRFDDIKIEDIDPESFKTLFFTFQHPSMDAEVKAYYTKLLDVVLTEDVPPEIERGLSERVLELGYATQVANVLKKYEQGADIDIARALQELSDTHFTTLELKLEIPWIRTDISELLNLEDDKHGLTWRLPCLNETMRPLRAGDFGLVCARPDAGKTSFLTCELTHMASQLPEGRPLIWLNNESLGSRIVTRAYQSALNASISELKGMLDAGTIKDEYTKAVGALDRIRILDVHERWNYEISDMLDELNPGLVVFDMIDNVRFGGQAAGSRTDQALEAMYQWARTKSVKLDCPVIATSQVSAEGDGLAFPQMHMLKDSKTGKQGAADFILMVGRSHDPMLERSRFISLPKNKLIREDAPKDPRAEVLFDWVRGRFNQPES